MRKLLFLLFLFYSAISFSKEKTATIQFTDYKNVPEISGWKWKINGVELSSSNDSIQFPVHYPKLDTIIYSRNDSAKKELILSRFTAGGFYFIAFNGCCMSFNIYDSDNSGYPKNYETTWPDTIAMKLENGTVQFKITNYTDTAFLLGSFGDIYGGYTSGIALTNNKLSEKVDPFLLPYSDYDNYVIIGKANFVDPQTLDEEWYTKEYHINVKASPNKEAVYTQELVNFQCRFFNRENLVVNYDYKTGKVNLEIK
jgi:hypothetical protein